MKTLMKKILLLATIWLMANTCLYAQEEKADLLEEAAMKNPQAEEQLNDAHLWKDPLLVQFERMMPRLAASLARLDNRISTLAVTGISFDPELDHAFVQVAKTKILGNLLAKNPSLKMITCEVCNQVQSEIKNGILKISRGIADDESRRALAKNLNVQGFMSGSVMLHDQQISVVITVHDAEEGRIILSDVIEGTPLPESSYYNLYAGQMTMPINLKTSGSTDHTAIVIGFEKTMRFAEYGLFGASMALFYGANDLLAESDKVSLVGLMVDGYGALEIPFLSDKSMKMDLIGGVGQFLAPQLNNNTYYKAGLKFTFGQAINFGLYSLSFNKTNVETPDSTGAASQAKGTAQYLTIGWQF